MPTLDDYAEKPTCFECRYYEPEHKNKDRFWGIVKIRSYCSFKEKSVIPADAPRCVMFLRKQFSANKEK